ncbi:LIM domain-containing protein [Cordyceps fumosorosea ARSEF 2679]|uniref:LIM domain-containing protein n=1 Tax=Cordyceps fumosorosea (strain ARSEF 2679) TaxID=1081104 RepID=A0A167WKX9_CORFA|nr:LIM domain-containing protein [Cordyceps fumosorosea ARSEF 2679]OAA63918.1 LIM domain-containing protein [Cordyceps fumosorosea ARSEF 2679]
MFTSREPRPRKVTPPSPSYMSKDQMASYLADLRTNRTPRPGGARPQPSHPTEPSRSLAGRFSLDASSLQSQTSKTPDQNRVPSHVPSVAAFSMSSRYSTMSGRGRDYYPDKPTAALPLKPSEVVPTATYMERGQRWMEKEEAFSLRDAMEQMDIKDNAGRETPDEESRIYQAALDEAAELVWQHQNGGGEAPRPEGPYRYRPHLRKNSYAHARTASIGTYGNDIAATGMRRNAGYRSVSNSSNESDLNNSSFRQSSDLSQTTVASTSHGSQRRKTYGGIGLGSVPGGKRKSSMNRNISGEINNPFSTNQIWEEPDSATKQPNSDMAPTPRRTLGNATQNPASQSIPAVAEDAPVKPRNRVEIHYNPPSQSHNGLYTTNARTAPRQDDQVERKNGVEVRSKDIREATSMRLKDRSAKLPEPTAVSDSPGRPIVSFDTNWKPADDTADAKSGRQAAATATLDRKQSQSLPGWKLVDVPSILVPGQGSPRVQPRVKPQAPQARAEIPTISIGDDGGSPSSSSIPTINIPAISVDGDASDSVSVPTINIPGISVGDNDASAPNIPMIVTPDDKPAANKSNGSKSAGSSRALPTPASRQLKQRLNPKQRSHWSPAPDARFRDKTLCHECSFPIEGRFVALAGGSERFHPQCFMCFTCNMSLEAMEISPEPEVARNARLERIERRRAGETIDEVPGETEDEDGDERLRFYCHLDWHEQFAPRCKHCKTPILGEHIVALGEHWHYGHFFCAECGDPFEHGMTHIEKDGYAWCIKCQTRRTERRAPKCKRCKKGVVGQYIQALGGEWHDECFRCAECKGGFDDGQVFPRDDGSILCTSCRMIELKR